MNQTHYESNQKNDELKMLNGASLKMVTIRQFGFYYLNLKDASRGVQKFSLASAECSGKVRARVLHSAGGRGAQFLSGATDVVKLSFSQNFCNIVHAYHQLQRRLVTFNVIKPNTRHKNVSKQCQVL